MILDTTGMKDEIKKTKKTRRKREKTNKIGKKKPNSQTNIMEM